MQNRHKEQPEKAEPNQCCITLGGNLINYTGDVGTCTADMLTVKLLLNSIILTPNAKFMTLDISNFYLMAPLDRYEYVHLELSNFPDNVIEQYKLHDITTKDAEVFSLGAENASMVYHKQDFWQTNTLENASMNLDTTRASSPQACGCMKHATFNLT